MFATAGIRIHRGHFGEQRHIGLHHFTSTMGTSSHRPFRKGVTMTLFACFIIVSGVAITVLGFMDVYDSGYTMMGMLMVSVAILLFLGSLRMFLMASKLRKDETTLQISRGTVASMVIEREDERGTLTVVMDAVNMETRSDDSNRPPDYAEATSDYFPESTSEIAIDTVNSDPPPPYGPPTYDQAMADKDIVVSGAESEDDNVGKQAISVGRRVDELGAAEPEPEHFISHGYQDMPSVTI